MLGSVIGVCIAAPGEAATGPVRGGEGVGDEFGTHVVGDEVRCRRLRRPPSRPMVRMILATRLWLPPRRPVAEPGSDPLTTRQAPRQEAFGGGVDVPELGVAVGDLADRPGLNRALPTLKPIARGRLPTDGAPTG